MPVGGGKTQLYQALFSAEGQENVIAAFRDLANGLKRAGTEQKRTARAGTELGRSFRNILLRTIAIVGVLRTFSLLRRSIEGVIRTGLEFNQTLETATLAIASLITATSDLVDANGEVVTGVEALNAAYSIAEDQVQQLRIAGIQTAATTQELVDAFQQAVGAGLQTGLTLDEIRRVTIRIAQAAGALGVPYRQLNEEIRSILGGIIDQNTRIAKALGLTNEQIRLAKEQGRLADFLLESFEAFGVAGDRITRTFAGLRSTLKETVEILAADITRPLFEQLGRRGFTQLKRIFDFDTAQIASEFEGLIDGLQDVFFFIGDLAGDSIEALVDGLASASEFMEENRDFISQIGQDIRRIVEGTATLVKDVLQIGPGLGIAANTLEVIADLIDSLVSDPMAKWVIALTAVGAALGIIAAIFGSIGAGVAVLVGGLLVVAGLLDQAITSPAERIRAIERDTARRVDEQREVNRTTTANARLLQTYEAQIRQLGELEQGSDAHTQALSRLLATERALIDAGFSDELEKANGNHEEAAKLIREQLELERDRLEIELSRLNAQQRRTATALGGVSAFDPRVRRSLEDTFETTDLAIGLLIEDLHQLNRLLGEEGLEIVSRDDADEAAKALEELRRRVQREMAAIEAELRDTESRLESAFERDMISISTFFTELTKARETAFRERLALLQELLAAERAAGELDRAADVEEKITDLEADRIVQQRKEALERREAEIKLADDLEKAEIELLEGTGRAAEAAKRKILLEFRDLRARLKVEGDQEGIEIIDALIDLETVRAQFAEVERIIEQGQQRLEQALDRIQLEEQIGVLGEEEARRETAAAYREMRGAIESVLPALRQFATTAADPEVRLAAQQLVDTYDQLGLEISGLTDEWLRFRAEFRDAAENELSRFLADAALEADNLGDALRRVTDLRSLLGSLAAAIVEITARMIALRIISASFGAFGGGGFVAGDDAAFGGFASGGAVRGPGGPRADRVPALLSAGEFVIQTASVRKFGVDFFERLNRGLVPHKLRRFQAGGLVGPSGRQSLAAGDGATLRGELTLGLQDGLVLDSMDTPRGERLIVKTITKNRRGVRRALGLP